MLITIQGTYTNGKIELDEIPKDISESQVFVTFLGAQQSTTTNQFMTFGIFAGSPESTEADFIYAEFHGDEYR
jgi:hypothetical protein